MTTTTMPVKTNGAHAPAKRKRAPMVSKRAVLKVPCPACKAQAGRSCISTKNTVTPAKKATPHNERRVAARQLMARMGEATKRGEVLKVKPVSMREVTHAELRRYTKKGGLTPSELTSLVELLGRFRETQPVMAFAYTPDVDRVLAFARMVLLLAAQSGNEHIA
jgi:hypothetical protein